MNKPVEYPHAPSGSPDTADSHHAVISLRYYGYIALALAAFLAGLIVGQRNKPDPRDSRIEWTTPPQPHPRSLQP